MPDSGVVVVIVSIAILPWMWAARKITASKEEGIFLSSPSLLYNSRGDYGGKWAMEKAMQR